jgi:predicted transglutaminase-like cysteine proteinase
MAGQIALDDHGVSQRVTPPRRRDGRVNSAASTNVAPRVASPPTIGPDAPDIFGSVALAVGRTPQDAKWRSVADFVPSARDGPWSAVLAKARSQSQREQLATVNAWVNHAISYTADASNYGVADYWGTARESLTRGRGDCKDYAIAKMELLRALGVPADDLYLMLVRDIERRQDHAILAVRQSGRFFILDSGFDGVADAEDVRGYRPILTFSGARRWVHGFRRPQGVAVASATPVADASP